MAPVIGPSSMTRYFEDIEDGETAAFGTYSVTEAEVRSFAEQYDPQPFHVDPDAADESIYGGLIASGWHTCAMTMRLIVDNLLSEMASRGAMGVDELRWTAPVRPGDDLSVRVEVQETAPIPNRPGRGRVAAAVTATNQADEPVLSFVAQLMIGRREAD